MITARPFPTDEWTARDRDFALAELRVVRLEHQLAVAHLDLVGTLLKQGLIQPWGARAAIADLEGGPHGQEQ